MEVETGEWRGLLVSSLTERMADPGQGRDPASSGLQGIGAGIHTQSTHTLRHTVIVIIIIIIINYLFPNSRQSLSELPLP